MAEASEVPRQPAPGPQPRAAALQGQPLLCRSSWWAHPKMCKGSARRLRLSCALRWSEPRVATHKIKIQLLTISITSGGWSTRQWPVVTLPNAADKWHFDRGIKSQQTTLTSSTTLEKSTELEDWYHLSATLALKLQDRGQDRGTDRKPQENAPRTQGQQWVLEQAQQNNSHKRKHRKTRLPQKTL